jgi:hypothetical protein
MRASHLMHHPERCESMAGVERSHGAI